MKDDKADPSKEHHPGTRAGSLPKFLTRTLDRPIALNDGLHEVDFSKTIRAFYDTGLEVRILPGTTCLTLKYYYHVPQWAVKCKINHKGYLGLQRTMFESLSETIGILPVSWTAATSRSASAHDLMTHHLQRHDSGETVVLDLSTTRRVVLANVATAVTLERRTHTGLSADIIPKDTLDKAIPRTSERINHHLRQNARLVRSCYETLSPLQKFKITYL